MGLKARRESNVTGTVEFPAPLAPLVVTVRYVTPDHTRDLIRLATSRGEVDWEKYGELYARATFVRADGFTARAAHALVDLEDDGDLAPDADGNVEMDVEMFVFFWRHARAQDFSNPIQTASQSLLKEAAAAKN